MARARFALASILFVPSLLFAGFGSTETYLPAVGRVPGKNGAQFYTTVWATNLTSARQTFTFEFLKTGQSNPSPASFQDSLEPGQTKVYENVVESKLGLSDALGAARILSSGEIFVSERIYNQDPGDDLGNTEGLFFAGVPKGFSISAGQSASIQGIDQGGSENFRYNFALIETGGGSPTVNVQVFDGSGTMLGQKAYPLQPWEHVQPAVDDVVPGIETTNARITATVTGGSGSALLAGAQVANESQDSSGFEMTFRDSLLGGGGGGTAGVTSLNGLTGALTLKAGSGVAISPSGSTLTIASTAGGGGLQLPFSGSTDAPDVAFTVTDTNGGVAIEGISNESGNTVMGVYGGSKFGYGVYGNSTESPGVDGNSSNASGVKGTSLTGYGLEGTGAQGGVWGYSAVYGVYGQALPSSSASSGVYGTGPYDGLRGEITNGNAGVSGLNHGNSFGVFGRSATGTGVYGTSGTGYAVFADGSFGATGVKSFVEPHPTDPTKEIRYVCLEGPESGTYFRGSGRIVGGFARIAVPDHFRTVTAESGITVVAMPVGEPAVLVCVKKSLDEIVIHGSADVEFDYVVNGVRKAFEGFQPVGRNRDFVPRSPRDDRFATLPAESLRRLKANGILNADGTINLETAHRLGWDQQETWKRAEAQEAKR